MTMQRKILYLKRTNEGELLVIFDKGKPSKRKYYSDKEKNLFIYGKAFYSFEWDGEYGKNIAFERPYKTDSPDDIMIAGSMAITVDDEPITQPVVPEANFEVEEVRHEKYNMIKTCIECGIPVYLAGPAGSGKNYTLEQIANDLDMNFYFSNSIQQEFKLTGFIDAGGAYHETEFYKACVDSKPCIFFLDEMDASIPEVLVLLNAAIANGYFEFPIGKVTLGHVRFVSAGNTVGSGSDDKYTGRMVLDQATLDRFAIIDFDYCLKVELHIAEGDTELVSFVRQLRDRAEASGIRATFSYRCIGYVVKLKKAKMDLQEILTISVLKGLDKDTINTLRISGDSEYHKALQRIQEVA